MIDDNTFIMLKIIRHTFIHEENFKTFIFFRKIFSMEHRDFQGSDKKL